MSHRPACQCCCRNFCRLALLSLPPICLISSVQPEITLSTQISDPHALSLRTMLNGQVVQVGQLMHGPGMLVVVLPPPLPPPVSPLHPTRHNTPPCPPLQEGNTSDLIFKLQEIIAYLSRSTTLLPGTLIMTGHASPPPAPPRAIPPPMRS